MLNKTLLVPMMILGFTACSSQNSDVGHNARTTEESRAEERRDEARNRAAAPAAGKSSAAYKADNTGKNQRDEETRNDTLLPTDQAKGSAQDVEITRRIREAITSSDQLSVNAQNIKIITLKGRTTLRGPVESVEERAKLVSIARQVAGPRAVTNQLEVAE
jgi:hyperosmotically inducible periplasmic protein